MEIISRPEAAKRQLRHYYTGKPCKNGHAAKRYVNTGSCMACIATYQSRYRRGMVIAQAGLKEIKILVDPRDESRIRQAAEAGILAYQFADGAAPSAPLVPPPPIPPSWNASDPT